MNKNQGQAWRCRHGVSYMKLCAQCELANSQALGQQQDSGAKVAGLGPCQICGNPMPCVRHKIEPAATPPTADEYEHFDAAVELAAERLARKQTQMHASNLLGELGDVKELLGATRCSLHELRARFADVAGLCAAMAREKAELETEVAWLQRENVRLGGRKRGAR